IRSGTRCLVATFLKTSRGTVTFAISRLPGTDSRDTPAGRTSCIVLPHPAKVSEGTGMNTVGLIPKRYVVAVPLMLAGVLLMCYSAMASARRGGTQNGVTMAGVAPAEHDRDSEYLEKRREFLSKFFGTGRGGVSPSAYTAGLAAAGVLPPR